MIRIGNSPAAPHPVIVSLAKALGDALDQQQVAIVRDHLDATCPHPYGHIGARGATCGECGTKVEL